jgi:hypothetical protein
MGTDYQNNKRIIMNCGRKTYDIVLYSDEIILLMAHLSDTHVKFLTNELRLDEVIKDFASKCRLNKSTAQEIKDEIIFHLNNLGWIKVWS